MLKAENQLTNKTLKQISHNELCADRVICHFWWRLHSFSAGTPKLRARTCVHFTSDSQIKSDVWSMGWYSQPEVHVIILSLFFSSLKVALNFQTAGLEMDLNDGLFRQNGCCGYVLKPDFLRDADSQFSPENPEERRGYKPLRLSIQVPNYRHRKIKHLFVFFCYRKKNSQMSRK